VGSTRLVFRTRTGEINESTVIATDHPPQLTRREHVLVALCRPTIVPGPFAQPESAVEIAAALAVNDATVKFHLSNLYDKFGIGEVRPRSSKIRRRRTPVCAGRRWPVTLDRARPLTAASPWRTTTSEISPRRTAACTLSFGLPRRPWVGTFRGSG
jgi:hypothetical protein